MPGIEGTAFLLFDDRLNSERSLWLAHMGRPHPQTPQARTKLKVAGYCLMVPTPNPALFAATAPPIPAQEAPFGWQLPTIQPTHTPAPHLASPRSPETARLEFLSTSSTFPHHGASSHRQLEPPGTNPYAGWCGRGEPRGFLLSQLDRKKYDACTSDS